MLSRLPLVLTLVVLALGMRAVLAQSGTDLFQQALVKERTEGNLSAAIALYRTVVDKHATDRPLVLKALMQLGQCYEKLGTPEAAAVYERVIREFADQPESVALARARLATLAPAGDTGDTGARSRSPAQRRLWAGVAVSTSGHVSPDGRYLSYVDRDTGDLAVYDFAAGNGRRLTNEGGADDSVISRDGRRVAYAWWDSGKERYVIRIVDLTSDGISKPKQVFDNPDIPWLEPHDWSGDGRFLAVLLQRVGRTTQIGLVDVRDGTLRQLKSLDWRGVTRMFFSPDGKYLAFDLPSGDRVGDTRDVFLMAVDGSRESPVAASPAREIMMGWSPDGKRLLFSSDRNGANGLWAQRIEDGKALGVPELLKSEIGHRSLGVTAAGSLFVGVNVGDLDIHLASVDFETGKISGTASRPVQTYVGSNRGWSWSPDGRSAVYVSQRDPIPGRRSAVIVRALETGTVRELIPQLGGFSDSIVWAPDGRSFVTAGADLKGRRGLYRIDAQTADTTTVVVSEPGTSFFSPQFSADGQRLYYAISKRGDVTFVERDLSSGSQRDVIRRTSLSSIVLSPDGRFIATTQDPNQQSAAVLLIPVGGGEPRELMRVTEPRFIQGVEGWAPDSRELIVSVAKTDAEEKDILLVSIDDGRFRPLEVPPGFRSGPIHVRPDGQQISYVAGKNAQEVWVLENFLPK